MFEDSLFWLLILNILAWFFFHMAISLLLMKAPDAYYEKQSDFYTPFKWEKNGEIWQELFHVRRWKEILPEGSSFVPAAYNKKTLSDTHVDTLKKFITETKRAEQTHWLLMLPAPLFFIWNPPWAGWIMIFYALLANLPFIIIQRYNRPRLERLYRQQVLKNNNK